MGLVQFITNGKGTHVSADNPLPVTSSAEPEAAAIQAGTTTAVGAAAVSIKAANANRKAVIIQNTGAADATVGHAGVTATTGFAVLKPDVILMLEQPYCGTAELFAIRQDAADSTVLVAEIV